MNKLVASQGNVLRSNNLEKNTFVIDDLGYTQIAEEKSNVRLSFLVQFKGDGEGTVLVKFDENDPDDLALRFNNSDFIAQFVELPNRYSGTLYAKSELGTVSVLVIEAVSQF